MSTTHETLPSGSHDGDNEDPLASDRDNYESTQEDHVVTPETQPRGLIDNDHYSTPVAPAEAPKSHRRRNIVAGLAAAGVAAVATVGVVASSVLGTSSEKQPLQPGTQPSAGAPEKPTPAPSETAPSTNPNQTTSPEGQVLHTSELDMRTYQFDVEGQTFDGVKELADKYAVRVKDAPTAKEATRAMIDLLNIQLNADMTAAKLEKYELTTSEDTQRVGLGAVTKDIVIPAFDTFVIANEPVEGTNPAPIQNVMSDLKQQSIGWFNKTKDEPVPYYSQFKVPDEKDIVIDHELENVTVVTLKKLTYTDNSGENSIRNDEERQLRPGQEYNQSVESVKLALSKELGRDGKTQEWRITGAEVPEVFK